MGLVAMIMMIRPFILATEYPVNAPINVGPQGGVGWGVGGWGEAGIDRPS